MSYESALWHGVAYIKKKPISTNLFVELAEIIKNHKAMLFNLAAALETAKSTKEKVLATKSLLEKTNSIARTRLPSRGSSISFNRC